MKGPQLGRRIQKLREARNWTRAELAMRTGSNTQAVGRDERNGRLGTHRLSKYAEAFGLDISRLLDNPGKGKRVPYKPFSLRLFEQRLKAGQYKNVSNAFRAVGRGGLSDEDRAEARRIIQSHFKASPAQSKKMTSRGSQDRTVTLVLPKNAKVTIIIDS